MAKDWKELKAEIEKELARIRIEAPEEVQLVRLGIIKSGQGNYGSYWGILWYLMEYTCYLGEHTLYNLLQLADEETIDIDALRTITRVSFGVGDWKPAHFMEALGFETINKFAAGILDVLDQLKTKEDYKELMTPYWLYSYDMRRYIPFPYNLGLCAYRKRTPEEIRAMIKWLPELEKGGG